jgi:hypothetical protein
LIVNVPAPETRLSEEPETESAFPGSFTGSGGKALEVLPEHQSRYYRFFFDVAPGAAFGRNVRDGQRSLSRSGSVFPLIWQSPSLSLRGE